MDKNVIFSRPRFLEKTEEIVVPFTSVDSSIKSLSDIDIEGPAREHIQKSIADYTLVVEHINFPTYIVSECSLKGMFIRFSPPWHR